jgi:hypothetical protein
MSYSIARLGKKDERKNFIKCRPTEISAIVSWVE